MRGTTEVKMAVLPALEALIPAEGAVGGAAAVGEGATAAGGAARAAGGLAKGGGVARKIPNTSRPMDIEGGMNLLQRAQFGGA